jgi:hypothetical protein
MEWTDVQPASAKILAKEAEGDSNAEVLYASVGRALSNWEFLQFSLAFLFAACSGAAFPYPVMRAFGQSMLVTAKLDMIQYAADASLASHKDLLARVTDLVKLVRGYNDRRNDIAHGVVQIFTTSSHYLIPTAGTSRKYPVYAGGGEIPLPEYCWTAAQIDRYAKAFARLNADCGLLSDEVNTAVESVALALFRERMLGASPGKSSAT